MQYKPVVYIDFEFFGDHFFEFLLNRNHIFTHSKLGTIWYTEYVRIYSDCRLAKI